jgi:hypothetical protein
MLAPGMRLVSQQELQQMAQEVGFAPEHSSVIMSAGGKRFCVEEFRLCFGARAGGQAG